MKVSISFEQAQSRYPDLVEKVLSDLRRGKSKEKNREASELAWSLEWEQHIKVMSFREMLESVGQPSDNFSDRYAVATRENVLEYLRDSILWGLFAQVGRWKGYVSSTSTTLPNEILDVYIQSYQEDINEKQRIAALTPEERQSEIQECLRKLRKSPGFVEMTVLRSE